MIAHTLALLVLAAAPGEPRVAAARASKSQAIVEMFRAAKVSYPPGEIFLRAFKAEKELELWAGNRGRPLARIKTYPICASSGDLGPKREQGDGQVPEGFYRLDRFNPYSNFHLSLGVDYPNASDRILGRQGRLGGNIFIHGDCVTIGCIPLQDDPIEEVYLIALDARTRGQRAIPIHIFPHRMDEEGMSYLQQRAGSNAALWQFWQGLQPGFAAFEASRRLPVVSVDPRTGRYVVRAVR